MYQLQNKFVFYSYSGQTKIKAAFSLSSVAHKLLGVYLKASITGIRDVSSAVSSLETCQLARYFMFGINRRAFFTVITVFSGFFYILKFKMHLAIA
jgi:DNA-binding transcriptional regulator GbsR (MarR family)